MLAFQCTISVKLFTVGGGAILPENGTCKVGNSTYINHFYPKITLKTPKKKIL